MDAAEQLVVYPSLVRFFVEWLQDRIDSRPEEYARDVQVLPREPEGDMETWPERVVVVRFDGDITASIITTDATVAFTVYAGTPLLPQDADDLGSLVRALVSTSARIEGGNPVARVTSSTGPLPVEDAGARACRYLTFELVIAGSVI